MIEIIPAIDIIDGKCVRLTQGDYGKQKTYSDNPLEVAKLFEGYGVRRLHVVDLDGAKSSHVVNLRVLEQIASHTDLVIDFGGGIKSENDLTLSFNAGASMLTIGSLAVKNPDLVKGWLKDYGAERFIIGADVKDEKISINGWKEEGEDTLYPFLERYTSEGVVNVLCTDISRDGMLQGPSLTLYENILKRFPELHLIASGGVGGVDDIRKLNEMGVPAVVFGKAFYEGLIRIEQLKEFLG
jgi:phosphoribosylformimino-5-aminoimidazole carboxamide ribotide isomerase